MQPAVTLVPMELASHGVGGPSDLPIPFLYGIVAGTIAVAVTFVVLLLAWREPRFADTAAPSGPPARRPWLGALGLVLTGWILGALYLGPDTSANGGLGTVYVFVWVGLVPLALVAGHVWRDLSPWRTVQSGVGRLTGRPNGFWAYPERLGHWPAALGLLAFVWLELASPDPGSIEAVRAWVGAYVAVTVVAGLVFGPRWFDRGDPFDVYSAIVARLSPFVRDGRWNLHLPLRTLPTVPIVPGLVAVLAVLLGSTAFDSFSGSQTWQSRAPGAAMTSLTLLGFCIVVGAVFSAAAMATRGVTADQRRALPGQMAHSLVPILVGYVFAHYLTYLVERGQSVLVAMLDPFGRGWAPLGDPATQYVLSVHSSTLAGLTVGFVVVGHVIAVVAAHDRALVVLPREHRRTGQLAMMSVMVGYTFGGLFLLFSV